jgi:hypothetical protein
VFDAYDFRAQHNYELGARLTYKLGKSYEEKLIENQRLRSERVNSTVFNSKDEEARRLIKEQQALIKDMQTELSKFKVANEKKALLHLD